MTDKRETLKTLLLQGDFKKYTGESNKNIDELSDEKIDLYYSRYLAVLEKELAESLGKSMVQGIAYVGCTFLGIKDKDSVEKQLANDKFTGELLKQGGKIVYAYLGPYASVFSIGSIFAKQYYTEYCEKDEKDEKVEENNEDEKMIGLMKDSILEMVEE